MSETESLQGRLAALAQAWSLELGEPYAESPYAVVLRVSRRGTPAVLKVGLEPLPWPTAQIPTLVAADGRGYVRVLEHDEPRQAVLLERLGPSLERDGGSPAERMARLGEVLVEAWEVPVEVAPPRFDKAQALLELIGRLSNPTDWERWGVALERAVAWAEELSASADPARDVLCHGDPHPGNLLAKATRTDATYLFVDPDGIRCEPAYDVGVALRGWVGEILAEDDPKPFLLSLRDVLCDVTAADPERAWQWGFVERVTTGLVVRSFGEVEEAQGYLDSAVRLAG